MTEKYLPDHHRLFCGIAIGLFAVFFFVVMFSQLPAEEPQGVPPLRVIYFTPKDREAPEGRHERLGHVLKHIQDFYRKEMESHGYGPMTFALEWDEPGNLKIYDVVGKNNIYDYPNGTEWQVREEVRENLLRDHEIDIDKEYVLICGAFVEWKEDFVLEHGPRVSGIGDFACGCAWVNDDFHVEPDLLSSTEPGGFSPILGPCTIGKYNSFCIGTIAHELGHCFGYPHDCEWNSQREERGVSLMGVGNYHYYEELRGEGPGTFLTDAAALLFSNTRAFNPKFDDLIKEVVSKSVHFHFDRLEASTEDGKLIIDGHFEINIPILGVIVYNDNLAIPDDYDAKSWVAKLEPSGDFHCEIGELERTLYRLRLKFIFPGGTLDLGVNYSNLNGTPTLEPINTFIAAFIIRQLLDQKEYDKAEDILKDLAKTYPDNNQWARKLKHLETVKLPPELLDPATVDETQTRFDLTYAKALEEKVGWYEPSRGILRDLGFMEVGSMFFEFGIFAHADSCYAFSLDKKWKEFEFAYGIQDPHPGSVVFVIRGDGKELFRSRIIRPDELHFGQINVSGVERLELITEDGGNSNANDWGLWIRPTLLR